MLWTWGIIVSNIFEETFFLLMKVDFHISDYFLIEKYC